MCLSTPFPAPKQFGYAQLKPASRRSCPGLVISSYPLKHTPPLTHIHTHRHTHIDMHAKRKTHTAHTHAHSPMYQMNMLHVLYAVNSYWGSGVNKKYAEAWTQAFAAPGSIMEKNFSLLGSSDSKDKLLMKVCMSRCA